MGLLTVLIVNLVKASESRAMVTKVIQATAYLEDLMFFEEQLVGVFILVTRLLPLRILKEQEKRDTKCNNQYAICSY